MSRLRCKYIDVSLAAVDILKASTEVLLEVLPQALPEGLLV